MSGITMALDVEEPQVCSSILGSNHFGSSRMCSEARADRRTLGAHPRAHGRRAHSRARIIGVVSPSLFLLLLRCGRCEVATPLPPPLRHRAGADRRSTCAPSGPRTHRTKPSPLHTRRAGFEVVSTPTTSRLRSRTSPSTGMAWMTTGLPPSSRQPSRRAFRTQVWRINWTCRTSSTVSPSLRPESRRWRRASRRWRSTPRSMCTQGVRPAAAAHPDHQVGDGEAETRPSARMGSLWQLLGPKTTTAPGHRYLQPDRRPLGRRLARRFGSSSPSFLLKFTEKNFTIKGAAVRARPEQSPERRRMWQVYYSKLDAIKNQTAGETWSMCLQCADVRARRSGQGGIEWHVLGLEREGGNLKQERGAKCHAGGARVEEQAPGVEDIVVDGNWLSTSMSTAPRWRTRPARIVRIDMELEGAGL